MPTQFSGQHVTFRRDARPNAMLSGNMTLLVLTDQDPTVLCTLTKQLSL